MPNTVVNITKCCCKADDPCKNSRCDCFKSCLKCSTLCVWDSNQCNNQPGDDQDSDEDEETTGDGDDPESYGGDDSGDDDDICVLLDDIQIILDLCVISLKLFVKNILKKMFVRIFIVVVVDLGSCNLNYFFFFFSL